MRNSLLRIVMTGCLVLAAALPAAAHRVNVFAWAEGGAIKVECTFNNGNAARNSAVLVTDRKTGATLAEGVTNTEGTASFTITDAMRAQRPDLRIVLNANEGHRNTWDMSAEEYLGAAPQQSASAARTPESGSTQAASGAAKTTAASTTVAAAVTDTTPATASAPAASTASVKAAGGAQPAAGTASTLDEAALKRIIDTALEEKLAPMRHTIAAANAAGPRFSEIVGGIGYLVGIAGLILWGRSRRR